MKIVKANKEWRPQESPNLQVGEVIDFQDEIALDLIERGMAVEYKESKSKFTKKGEYA